MGKLKDISGKVFGRLTAINSVKERGNHGQILWNCKCVCGNHIIVKGGSLQSGNTKSCSCMRKEQLIKRNYKHGDSQKYNQKRLYKIWVAISHRCKNPQNQDYSYYGGRGININETWENYITFKKWSFLNGYSDNLEIDRINNDGNYEPSNCRWITHMENSQNSRVAKLNIKKVIEIKALLDKKMSIKGIAKKYNVSASNIYAIKQNKTWRNV